MHLRAIIAHAEETKDPVTADLATTILAEEEGHRTQFAGFRASLGMNCD